MKPDLEKSEILKLYQLQEQQMIAIHAEQACKPMIESERESFMVLQSEYLNNPPFLVKVGEISKKYTSFRKVKKDGNCFYRGFLFSVFEQGTALCQKMATKIKAATPLLKETGFEPFVFEDYQEILVEELLKKHTGQSALILMNDIEKSNLMILFIRFLTSAAIKNQAFLYESFMEGMTVQQYCQGEVQPMDKESDQISITALLKYLEIGSEIVYLDGSPSLQTLNIPDGTVTEVKLLYRPGHYDIIY